MRFNKKNYDTKQRFGIRKLSIGTCSVLLATLFLGVSVAQTPKAHADVVNQNKAVEQTGENSASPQSSSSSVVLSAKIPASAGAVTAKSNSNSDSAAVANSAATSTADSSSQPSSQAGSASSQKQDVNQASKVASIQARAAVSGTNTNQQQALDQIKNSAAEAIPSTDGRYTLYLSRTSWGNAKDGNNPITIWFSGNTQAGDVVTVRIPNYNIINVNAPVIDPTYGSATVSPTPVNGYTVITFNFTSSGVILPEIVIPADNGAYIHADKPFQITPPGLGEPISKDITWTIKSGNNAAQDQKPAALDIYINPVWNPQFTRANPKQNSSDPNALKKLIPNYQTEYDFTVNESNGVTPGQDYSNVPYPSPQVNSAVNYGTVITIPMPNGFVLDADATKAANNFKDQTTITQDGKNIIINVPKGSGIQALDTPSNPYKIVGHYNIPMPDQAETITAGGPITIVQKLNESGTVTKEWSKQYTVSEEFYGKNDKIPVGSMPIYAGEAYNTKQLLSNGKKQIVSYFGATNQAIGSFSNYSGHFIFSFDKGLSVTEIKTPTMTGTNNYKYTITYADGTTASGQVNAGQTIVGDKVITGIEISPDDFAQNQGTASTMPSSNNKFSQQTQDSSTNAFLVYGAVANTVKPTTLHSSMYFTGTINGDQTLTLTTSKASLSRTVVSLDNLTSSTGIFGWQGENLTASGQQKVGYLSSYSGGGQTNNIYEPIFYYVLPEWFTANDFSDDFVNSWDFHANSNNGVTGKPKLSIFAVPTDTPGLSRQVVKIDYTGTGYNFLAGQGANNQIWLNTLSDAINGTYKGMIYVVSPTTKLTNIAYNAADTSNFAPTGVKFNKDWVQGNTANLYYVGSADYKINQVGGQIQQALPEVIKMISW